MTNNQLIISLIQQDIKHNQLIIGLDNLGLASGEEYPLQIQQIVCQLMEVPEALQERWNTKYTDFMVQLPSNKEDSQEALQLLSRLCHQHLVELVK